MKPIFTGRLSSLNNERSHRIPLRQFSVIFLAVLLVSCSGDGDQPTPGIEGSVKGFIGGVAADEPRAALEGQRVLASGGSAADAAATMYFTMAVTYPAAASLGGGGVCLVYNPKEEDKKARDVVRALNFLPGVPASAGGSATTAVPGNAVGFAVLHSRYGRLPWARHVSVGEQYARFGTQMSRALWTEVANAKPKLDQDAESRRILSAADGAPARAGDFFEQAELAGIFGILRARGPGDLYRGASAALLAEAYTASGGTLTVEDLRQYRPVWEDTLQVEVGNHIAHFPPHPAASRAAATLLALLLHDDAYEDADTGARYHLLAEAAAVSIADSERSGGALPTGDESFSETKLNRLMSEIGGNGRNRVRPRSGQPGTNAVSAGTTGFAAVDKNGMAVACGLTMNGAFGTGRIAKGTGIFMAVAGDGSAVQSPAVPLIVMNANSDQTLLVSGGGGNAAAIGALPHFTAAIFAGGDSLTEAMAQSRIFRDGASEETHVAPTLSDPVRSYLQARGHQLVPDAHLGLINGVYCFRGMPRNPASCGARSDSRGYGLARTAEE